MLIPPINARGKFTFKPPFEAKMKEDLVYTVTAIRSIVELYESESDPYKQIYEDNGISKDQYTKDLEDQVPIVVFTTTMGIEFVVQSTNVNFEIALLFITIISIILMSRSKLSGAIIFVIASLAYYGPELINEFTYLSSNSVSVDSVMQMIISLVCVIIPIFAFFIIAFAKEQEKRPNDLLFAVCMDARTHSPELKRAVVQGLTSTGANVLDLGLAPTPLGYYSEFAKK